MIARTMCCIGVFLSLCVAVSGALLARENKPAYESLLEKVKRQDSSVDFTALRMAYADRPVKKGETVDSDLRKQLFPALGKSNDEAIEIADKVLAKNYLDIDAHIVSALAYKEKHDAEHEKLHNFVAEGLCRSILASGDGQTLETAYVVISVDEEYTILRVLGWHRKEQTLLEGGGHHYDKMDVFNPKTQQQATVYFNIDRPYAAEIKELE
jgi:uncharacterized protein DUF4919